MDIRMHFSYFMINTLLSEKKKCNNYTLTPIENWIEMNASARIMAKAFTHFICFQRQHQRENWEKNAYSSNGLCRCLWSYALVYVWHSLVCACAFRQLLYEFSSITLLRSLSSIFNKNFFLFVLCFFFFFLKFVFYLSVINGVYNYTTLTWLCACNTSFSITRFQFSIHATTSFYVNLVYSFSFKHREEDKKNPLTQSFK